jgi:hypothetical protein
MICSRVDAPALRRVPDEAFTAPSKHGLPSTAAIEAHLAISPEPEVRAGRRATVARGH